MNLLRLGKKNWEVLAVCSDRSHEECDALDVAFAADEGKKGGSINSMVYRLTEYIPENGPEIRNAQKAKKLQGADDLYELIQKTGGGGTPRIYYFTDGDRTIVCAAAEIKKGEKQAQQRVINHAEEVRRRYFEAKTRNSLVIEDLTDDDDE